MMLLAGLVAWFFSALGAGAVLGKAIRLAERRRHRPVSTVLGQQPEPLLGVVPPQRQESGEVGR